MRKLLLGVVAALALSSAACTCTAEKNAVSNIQATHDLVLPGYVAYVEADASLDAAQKEDRKKLVESLRRMVEALRKSLED